MFQVIYQIITIPDETVNILCEELDFTDSYRGMRSAQLSYCYLLVKYLDLFDTVFFVLRKRTRQISFLHVYHHVAILCGAYMAVAWVPGMVHTFDYMLLTSVNCSFDFEFPLNFKNVWTQIIKKKNNCFHRRSPMAIWTIKLFRPCYHVQLLLWFSLQYRT